MADSPFLAAQKTADTVAKQGENKAQHYSYARAEDVIREAQRALHEAGLVGAISFTDIEERPITSQSGTSGIYVRVACSLVILNGDGEVAGQVTGFGAGIDYPGDKAVYKAMTGASKYAYASALGIPFGDDPEDTATSAPEIREAAERPKGFASEKQANMLKRCLRERNAKDPENIVAYLEANFDGSRGGGISRAIDRLMDKSDETVVDDLQSLATAWHAEQSDIPADDADLPPKEEMVKVDELLDKRFDD